MLFNYIQNFFIQKRINLPNFKLEKKKDLIQDNFLFL